ncbi:MAG: tRNA (N6-isopentenyl adenosine(37)-C2)-methylthiotransferase MiaB [Mycoplasmatota bacterium]
MKPNLNEARKRTKKEVLIKTNEYILNNKLNNIGKNKTYFIKTYGCQMNERDSEMMKAILEDMGFIQSDIMEESDLILLNTCAIRENAHNKVFGYLGRIKHLKETRPDIICGLCGCMAQEEVVVNELEKKFKWMDMIFGTHNIHDLPNILNNAIEKKKTQIEVFSIEGDIIENTPVKRQSKYKAFVNIMLGCDKFCTYCIVPYTRGKERSRTKEFILKEVNQLVKDGYSEVTLLGQNVNAYGKDLDINYTMKDLLLDVAKTGIKRIRFMTSHPWDFNDEMIEVIKNNKNIMPYIHLPLQSGSNNVLKLMNRRYTKEEYINLFKKIKKAIPTCSITTDIIVGFPNETKEDFNETLDVVKVCKFDSAFTFLFSPREGTPAAKMDDNVTLSEKNERLQTLNKLINQYQEENTKEYLNKTVPVLFERRTDDSKYLFGYTDTFKSVYVEADDKYLGQIVDVLIIETKKHSMIGQL